MPEPEFGLKVEGTTVAGSSTQLSVVGLALVVHVETNLAAARALRETIYSAATAAEVEAVT